MSNNPYYDNDVSFVVGFAGSGKSTLLAEKCKASTLVLVPTHKAASVLKDKGIEHVYTIHSVLKLVPSLDDNFRGKLRSRLTRIGKTDLSTIKEIFIDEFSMISQEIMDLLMSILPLQASVTIYGDPYQLPTITGNSIQVFEPSTTLTNQYRAKNIKATELFMNYMYYIRGDTKTLPVNTYKKTRFWKALFNHDTDRIVAYTNARVIELNETVANDDVFRFGDELLMNGIPVFMDTLDYNPMIYPKCMTKGELMPQKKLEATALTANSTINTFRIDLSHYSKASIVVNDSKFLIYYDANHYATEQKLKADVEKYQKAVITSNKLADDVNIPQWCKENRGASGVKARGRAWSKYLSHRDYVFNLARPYATTVHKVQGSEYRAIFIDEENLSMVKSKNPMMYARLMYVALSRGIEEVYFV